MELRHLRYFIMLVEEMHFGKAAEKLHIVQPALSKQICALEEQIGTQLLIRNSRKMVLTHAGELFYREAVQTLKQVDNAVMLAQHAGRGLIGTLRIGYAGNAALSGAMSFYLYKYRQSCPDVKVSLQEMPPRELHEALRDARLDLVFATDLAIGDVGPLIQTTLRTWDWVIGMEEHHPLAAFTQLRAKQLINEPFVLYGDKGINSDQIAILKRLLGCPPNVAYQATDTLATLTLAAAGYGLAFLPGTFRNIQMPGIIYRGLDDFSESLNLDIIHRENDNNPIVRGFLDVISKNQTDFQS